MNRKMAAAVAAALALAASAGAPAAPGYTYQFQSATVTDLGVLANGTSSIANDINDGGIAVGSSYVNGKPRAFFHFFSMQAIGDGPGATESVANAINANHAVVGRLKHTSDPAYVSRAWHWTLGASQVTTLHSNPQAPLNYNWSMQALGINDAGVIVGGGKIDYSSGNDPIPDTQGDCYSSLPIRWSSFAVAAAMVFCPAETMNTIDTIAHDVDNSGRVVGEDNGTTTYRMFLKAPGYGPPTAIPEPANPSVPNYGGFKRGSAQAISNTGFVAGSFYYGATSRAFYWNGTSAKTHDLGVFAGGTHSSARDVNDTGFVAGTSEFVFHTLSGSSIRKAAFLWHSNIGMVKLPALSTLPHLYYENCEANALNNRVASTGRIQVVGYCHLNGQTRAVRWDITVIKKLAPIQP